MKDLVKKVAVGISTGGLILHALTIPALGAINITISSNGSSSSNTTTVTSSNTQTVSQFNDAVVNNTVEAVADTGDNDANDNTGGNVSVDTGNSTATSNVSNSLNNNSATLNNGSGVPEVSATISENGTDSDNDVVLTHTNSTTLDQTNFADVTNDVYTEAASGENNANDNTNGDVSIDTGNATSDSVVENEVNSNDAVVGSAEAGDLMFSVLTNGSDSDNTIALTLDNAVDLSQYNEDLMNNEVDTLADTGDNDANDNTGGNVSVDTGNSEAGALLDDLVNFNTAEVGFTGEVDGTIDLMGNGTGSDNDAVVALDWTLTHDQTNFDDQTNAVDSDADSGDNLADDNTDGEVVVDTGDADSNVELFVDSNSNVFVN